MLSSNISSCVLSNNNTNLSSPTVLDDNNRHNSFPIGTPDESLLDMYDNLIDNQNNGTDLSGLEILSTQEKL
jgi:hypothetical protein